MFVSGLCAGGRGGEVKSSPSLPAQIKNLVCNLGNTKQGIIN